MGCPLAVVPGPRSRLAPGCRGGVAVRRGLAVLFAVCVVATLSPHASALAASATILVGSGGPKVRPPPNVTIGPDDAVTWTHAPNSSRHHIMSDTQTQL